MDPLMLLLIGSVGVFFWSRTRSSASATPTTPPAPVNPPPKKVVAPVINVAPAAPVKTIPTNVAPGGGSGPTAAWGNDSGYQPQNSSGLGYTTVQISPPMFGANGVQVSEATFANYDAAGNQVGPTFTKSSAAATSGPVRPLPLPRARLSR